MSDALDRELADALDRRVRHLHDAPLTLDAVKGRAGRIRRRRQVVAVGAALAVAAAVVPVALIAIRAPGGADDPGPTAPSATRSPDRGVAAPAIPYLQGRTFHEVDGSTVAMPRRYDDVARIGEFLYAERNDDATGEKFLDVLDDGVVVESVPMSGSFALSDTGGVVGYLNPDGDLLLRDDPRGEVLFARAIDLPPDGRVTAIAGCEDAAGPCAVYLDQAGQEPSVVTRLGTEPAFPGRAAPLGVNDATGSGLVSTLDSASESGSCGGLYDRVGGRTLFTTCTYQVLDIAPDSRHVVGTDPYGDGGGSGYVAILDTEGTEVARFEEDGALVNGWAWEDADHLLAVVGTGISWSVVRLGVDGTVERVLGPIDGDAEALTPAYRLSGTN